MSIILQLWKTVHYLIYLKVSTSQLQAKLAFSVVIRDF